MPFCRGVVSEKVFVFIGKWKTVNTFIFKEYIEGGRRVVVLVVVLLLLLLLLLLLHAALGG